MKLSWLTEDIDDWVNEALVARDTHVEINGPVQYALLGTLKYKEYDKWAARVGAIEADLNTLRITIDQRSVPEHMLRKPTPETSFHDDDKFFGETEEDVSIIINKDGIFVGEWLLDEIKYRVDWWPPEVTDKFMAVLQKIAYEIKIRP